jgi:lipopolysaccharide export system protein LptA
MLPSSKEEIKKESGDESYFEAVEYYLSKKNEPSINLLADNLTLSTTENKTIAIKPHGVIYREASLEPINFSSKLSKIDLKDKIVELIDEVKTNVDKTTITANKMDIYIPTNILSATGKVNSIFYSKTQDDQVNVDSNFAIYRSKENFFEFKGQVKGQIIRKRVYEESVNFSADLIDFDGMVERANLKGNVALVRDNYKVFSNNGSIFLENYNKKLKYYSLYDDVRLEERVKAGGRELSRKAFSEKLEGYMGEKKIILTGLPKVFQEKDIIRGNTIIIRENVETVEVDDANTNITLGRE